MRLRRLLLITLTVAIAAVSGLTACQPGADVGEEAVAAARAQLGQAYRYGGDSRADGGFDCSGLTSHAWKRADVNSIPRTSRGQWAWVDKISESELRPGDLVFYSAGGPYGTVSHVAMYAGDDTLVHARRTGTPVLENNLSTYWTSNLVGYGRIPSEALPS